MASRGVTERHLDWVVGGVAGSVLLTEIALTRLFSVLLFYHYSFLAVALALFGLAVGGLSAARQRDSTFQGTALEFLRRSLVRASAGLLALVPLTVMAETLADEVAVALLLACASAAPLFFLGEALALALSVGREQIHRLYAVDLLSSAGAALAAIIAPALAALGGLVVGSRGLLIAAVPC